MEWANLIRKAIWVFRREYAFSPTEIYLPYEIFRDVMSSDVVKYQWNVPNFLFGMKLAVHDGPVTLIARTRSGGFDWMIRWTPGGFDEAIVDGDKVVTGKGRARAS